MEKWLPEHSVVIEESKSTYKEWLFSRNFEGTQEQRLQIKTDRANFLGRRFIYQLKCSCRTHGNTRAQFVSLAADSIFLPWHFPGGSRDGSASWVPTTVWETGIEFPAPSTQLHSSSSHRGHVGGDRADRNSPPLKYMNKQINCMYSHIGYFNVRHSACGTDRSPQRTLSQISILVCSIPCDFCYWCILFNWYCVLVDWSVKKELTAKSVLLWIMINNIHAFQK